MASVDLTSAADAADLLDSLASRGWTLAVAESLTGGLVTARLVAVPGASSVLRGGVTAYATDLKASVLGSMPTCSPNAAPSTPRSRGRWRRGTAPPGGGRRARDDRGGRPGPAGRQAPGLVHVAVASPERTEDVELHLDGDRAAVREATVVHLLAFARGVVTG